jgi:hypothetical protein
LFNFDGSLEVDGEVYLMKIVLAVPFHQTQQILRIILKQVQCIVP